MRILLSFFAAMFFINVHAQNDIPVVFKTTTYSFGKIKQHVPVSTEFTFTYNGDKPLLVNKPEVSCGCTESGYPKAPIMKGKTGTIKVTYDAEEPGSFKKTVNVTFANYRDKPPITLTFEGEVEAKP